MRRPATRTQIVAVSAIGVVAGSLAALTSDAAPTGTDLFDVVWRVALVMVSTIAGARARRWSLAAAAGLVVVGPTRGADRQGRHHDARGRHPPGPAPPPRAHRYSLIRGATPTTTANACRR